MSCCKERKCKFWNGEYCTDEDEYINAENGGMCCRFHPDAVLKEDYKKSLKNMKNSIMLIQIVSMR